MQAPPESVKANDIQADEKASRDATLRRALLWIGVAGVSVAISFFVIRSAMRRPPADPTTQRIEALIDEANRLLKALEEQK
ncbi:MAG TPA: hypothetical protein VMD07_09855 [Candidatus Acidoferrales bacterium]|nr:hypothetical protein [Candidatus Acidoferrales bacterium]